MTLLRMILVGLLLAGGVLGLAACKDGGTSAPSQDWPPRRTSGGHD